MMIRSSRPNLTKQNLGFRVTSKANLPQAIKSNIRNIREGRLRLCVLDGAKPCAFIVPLKDISAVALLSNINSLEETLSEYIKTLGRCSALRGFDYIAITYWQKPSIAIVDARFAEYLPIPLIEQNKEPA